MDIPRTHLIRMLIVLILLLAPVLAANAQRTDRQEVVEKQFTVSADQTLFLTSDLGSVKLTGGSGDQVVVRVLEELQNGASPDAFDRFNVDFHQTSRGVEIDGQYDAPSGWRSRNQLRVSYEITVPRRSSVDLKTAGGSIAVRSLSGEAHLKTSGGSLEVRDIDGVVQAHTSGGSIRASDLRNGATLETSGGSITASGLTGALKLETSGGSITAENVDGTLYAHTSGGSIRVAPLRGSVQAETSGGSVTAELVGQPDGKIDLSSSGGSVTLHVDPSVHASIDAASSGGRVRLEVPVRGSVERNHVRGDLNGGGPVLTLRSSGGGVNIMER
ncbi:MAG TPA: DUF4097 family beta strand repeat-containing protein [Rhodothermales bacterium]|nr:DUF4097 family beta strand repeat-containing protein [Rhodothermales bacterium]